jgi:DNA helicase IV
MNLANVERQIVKLLDYTPEAEEVSSQRLYYWRNQVANGHLTPTLAKAILKAYGKDVSSYMVEGESAIVKKETLKILLDKIEALPTSHGRQFLQDIENLKALL